MYKELILFGLCILAIIGCLFVAYLRSVEDQRREERKIEERKRTGRFNN